MDDSKNLPNDLYDYILGSFSDENKWRYWLIVLLNIIWK
jgi:hypothetical protein